MHCRYLFSKKYITQSLQSENMTVQDINTYEVPEGNLENTGMIVYMSKHTRS